MKTILKAGQTTLGARDITGAGLTLAAALLLGLAVGARAATFTWDGGAWPPDAYWDTAANWNQGRDKPNTDDDLLFDGLQPLLNTNNRPADLAFRSMTLSAPGYQIGGNLILKLTDGLTISHGTGITRFKGALVPTKAQTIQVSESQARLSIDTGLQLPSNDTEEDVVGNPSPPQVITFNLAGSIEIAELLGRGGKFEKYGSGAMVLNRTWDEYLTGDILEGTLQVTGPADEAEDDKIGVGLLCRLHQGAVLQGGGTIRSVDVQDGGTVYPFGPLTILNSLHLGHTEATLFITIGTSATGYSYGQLKVGTSVVLAGPGPAGSCKLTLSWPARDDGGFRPVLGQTFRIIDNLGPNPVSGTFAGLPHNAEFEAEGLRWRITYYGGDGNDVDLTVVGVEPSGHTRVWDGGGNNNDWTNRFNWVGDARPGPGDDLVFPLFAARFANVNSFPPGSLFNSIQFIGSGYILSGLRVVLNNGLNCSHPSGNNVVGLPLHLAQNQRFVNSAPGTLLITGNINLDHHDLHFRNDGGNTTVTGVIFGSGGVFKHGPAWLMLSGANTYDSLTLVYEGILRVGHSSALGTSFGTTVLNSGSLWLGGGLSISDPLTLNGTGAGDIGALVSQGNNTLTGNLVLNSTTLVSVSVTSGQLAVHSAISGPGGLDKTGPGRLLLLGGTANTYAGTTLVRDGELQLAKGIANGAIPGTLIIGDDIGSANSALVEIGVNHQISDSASVGMFGDGKLLLTGQFEKISWLTGNGTVDIGGRGGMSHLLDVTVNNNDSAEFSGTVIGTDGQSTLRKLGSGTLTLSGNCSHGQSHAGVGRLLIHGSHDGSVWVGNNGILGGGGAIKSDVTLNGGTLNPGPGGVLNVSGNFQADSASQLVFDIDGTTPGLTYDQLDVTGTVTLNSPQLSLVLGVFSPALASQFTLINGASGPVIGTFGGLQNGDPLSAGNFVFQINYTGGTGGDDVVLTTIESMQLNGFSMMGGGMGQISGQFLPNQVLVLEAATELKEPIRWNVVSETRTDDRGNFRLTDPEAPRFNRRFYRVRTQ